MKQITSKNLLAFIKEYFEDIGLNTENGEDLSAKTFSEGLVLKLPAVCIVPGNKPNDSRSKQTHIHVTGNNRYFFFDQNLIDNATQSSEDIYQRIYVSPQNLQALEKKTITESTVSFQTSHTYIKIAYRQAQDSQVQISKLRMDGDLFIALRKTLYTNDLLILLKKRTSKDMIAIGIPHSYYNNKYAFSSDIYTGLESKGKVTVHNVLSRIKNNYTQTDVIESDDPIHDAIYQEMINSAIDDAIDQAVLRDPVTYTAVPYVACEKTKTSHRAPTNISLGKAAIRAANYKCSANSSHTTFEKKDGTIYMEVHHLIPLAQQEKFENMLDTPANLIPLCPNCHTCLHYGRFSDIKPIISSLHKERKEALEASGLCISLDDLLEFYR